MTHQGSWNVSTRFNQIDNEKGGPRIVGVVAASRQLGGDRSQDVGQDNVPDFPNSPWLRS